MHIVHYILLKGCTMSKSSRKEVCIVLAGEAGQGIQSIETTLALILKQYGFHVYATKEYMSRVRGGVNSTEIRAGAEPVRAFSARTDLLVALVPEAIDHLQHRISKETVVLGDAGVISHPDMLDLTLDALASEAGGKVYTNTVCLGALCAFLGIPADFAAPFIEKQFSDKGEDIVANNITALTSGWKQGQSLVDKLPFTVAIPRDAACEDRLLINGSEAVAMGAVAGGCNYTCAYPMSPGTGVLNAMAGFSKTMDIIVEQVEDEIGVINMALGAWYAGARALVTSSGGGFALMSEGLSLSGMTETPAVIHIAQRPGPATGLPTRTEQGDLNLVVYGGHGDFPRMVYAPGDIEEAFALTRRAFEQADAMQAPAIILTDQYFVDTYYDSPGFGALNDAPENAIVKTKAGYERYALSENGISPRGIPGFGSGLVSVDSDEHDTSGHITESAEVRRAMVDKRMKKAAAIRQQALDPVISGNPDASIMIVGWGSTKNSIIEAMDSDQLGNAAVVHFPQVFPISEKAAVLLAKAKHIAVIENNVTGQFADLLEKECGISVEERLLQSDGQPFSVETVREWIADFMKNKRS